MVRILIVEDERDFKFLIQQRFAQHIQAGIFDFCFAYNGREALDILRQTPPFDVVITDIQMPELDGLSLLEKIQENSPHTKTIVVSAYDDFHYIRRAMNYGAFDFIAKPLVFKDLELSLEKCRTNIIKQRSKG